MERSMTRGGHMTLPLIGLLIAMISVQGGASLAKGLFPVAGATGTAALRVVFAALFLGIALRPWKARITRDNYRPVLIYGVVLGVMNLCFYAALQRIPLGIAVAIEFVGPLGVAVAASRKASDFLWVAMAAAGLVLLTPLTPASHDLDPVGIAFALAAGLCWALYIVFGQRASHDHGHRAAALGMIVAAAVALPVGLAEAGGAMFNPAILPLAMGVALLSSALPYTLEMIVLRRIPTQTFGTLMSLEPAIAAIAGYLLLRESLPLLHWIAIFAIMAASAGAAFTAARAPEIPIAP